MQDNENIETIEQIKNLKDDLENISKDKIRGMIIRSKVQWLEEGEKTTICFCFFGKEKLHNKTYIKTKYPRKYHTESKFYPERNGQLL